MFKAITITTVRVLDQDEALDFYVGKLGFKIDDDVDMGFMRWLTISLPSDPGRQLLLEVPGPPAMNAETGAQVRDLLTKGALGAAAILTTDDCQNVYDMLKARGPGNPAARWLRLAWWLRWWPRLRCRRRSLLVEVVAVAGGNLQVVAADSVDQPVLIVDTAGRPAGERAFQHLGFAGAVGRMPPACDDPVGLFSRRWRRIRAEPFVERARADPSAHVPWEEEAWQS
jgi:catechol 2,3-dioxygenase-like lactoylglutathione lyase family enzyme